jgi:DNA polymerase-3 subunit delta
MSIYVFSGSDNYLLDIEKNNLVKKYQIDDFNISSYNFLDSNPLEILSEIKTVSLFGEKRMVVVSNPELLKNTYKNIDVVNKYINYFKNPNLDTVLVFICNFPLTESLDINQVLLANATYKVIADIKGDDLLGFIKELCNEKGYKIDDFAITELIERTSSDTSAIMNELDKLMLYNDDKNITLKSVKLLVNKGLEDNIFNLLNAFLAHDSKKLLEIYDDFITLNEDEMRIISSINNKLEEIMYTKVLMNQGLSKDQIASYFKVKPGRAYYMMEAARKMNDSVLKDLINRITELDYKIKSGLIDKRLGFQLFLLGV